MPVLYEYHDGVLVYARAYGKTWKEMREIVKRRYNYRKKNSVSGVDTITIGWKPAPDSLHLKRRSSILQKGSHHD